MLTLSGCHLHINYLLSPTISTEVERTNLQMVRYVVMVLSM